MALFDMTDHPSHRHVSTIAGALASTSRGSRSSVILHAQVPPGKPLSLVLVQNYLCEPDDCPTPPPGAKDFRLRILAESSELEVAQPGAENEWRNFQMPTGRAENRAVGPFLLQFDDKEGAQEVQFVVTSPDCAPTRLRVRRPGENLYAEQTPSEAAKFARKGKQIVYCPSFKLPSGGTWEVLVEAHKTSPEDFLFHIFGFSKFCSARLSLAAEPKAPGEAKSDDETAFLKAAAGVDQWASRTIAQEELTQDNALLIPRQTESKVDSDKVTVRLAYLERLHKEAMYWRQVAEQQKNSMRLAESQPRRKSLQKESKS